MKKIKVTKTSIDEAIEPQVGESIEKKIERIKNNKEGISEGADLHYQDRGDGIPFETDIRSDKWDRRIEQHDKITSSYINKREAAATEQSDTDGNTGGSQET